MSDLGAEVLSNGSAHVMNESHQAFLKTDKRGKKNKFRSQQFGIAPRNIVLQGITNCMFVHMRFAPSKQRPPAELEIHVPTHQRRHL